MTAPCREAFTAGSSLGHRLVGMGHRRMPRSKLRTRLHDEYGGIVPAEGLEATGAFNGNPEAQQFSMHAFGAQFAEVRVNVDTGEVRVPRLLGVFAAGRIINPKTARSQLLGGMTMGLSMALHEESVLDPRFGDLRQPRLRRVPHRHQRRRGDRSTCPGSTRTIHTSTRWARRASARLGIVGTAAAIANAVYHATGIRVRDLPITLDKLLQ